MVVVINSKPDASVVKEIICKNCGVTLQYVLADVKRGETSDYTGDKDYYYYIICPPCGHKLHVKR